MHDGDTFTAVRVARLEPRPGLRVAVEETVTVRLPCGDAAELRADGGGYAARAALASALEAGGLSVVTAWKREKYGRLLADVERPDGGSLCGELRDAGWLR